MARYRASWRETSKPLPGTLPNGWVYRCADFESASRAEAEAIAKDLLTSTSELLGVLELDAAPGAADLQVDDPRPQPTFTGLKRAPLPSRLAEETPQAPIGILNQPIRP